MSPVFRKDNPNGITAPNPDGNRDIIEHITKHRGQKTPYTSVSEDRGAINHFDGVMYTAETASICTDGHDVISHSDISTQLKTTIQSTTDKRERALASRAFMLATRAREALIDWQLNASTIPRKDRITHCFSQIQKYFNKV